MLRFYKKKLHFVVSTSYCLSPIKLNENPKKVIYTLKNNKKVKCKKELKFLLFIMQNSRRFRRFGMKHVIYFPYMEKSSLVILLNFSFCVSLKKENNTGLHVKVSKGPFFPFHCADFSLLFNVNMS